MLKVIIVNGLALVAVIATWHFGQVYSPEIMSHEAVKPPMIMGLACLAVYLMWWSYATLSRKPKTPQTEESAAK